MSNAVSVLVYSRKFGSPIRKAVMVYFAERASDNGEGIWASKATIAAAIECGRSTVIRTINEFLAEGLLVETGKRPCRNGETTEYAIDLEKIAALDVVSKSGTGTSPAAGLVQMRDPYQSRSGTPTSPAAGPKPSLEPSKEPPYSEPCGSAHSGEPASQFVQDAVQVLRDAGIVERRARSMLGAWRRDHSDAEVRAAFRAAKLEAVADPPAYIAARLGRKAPNMAASEIRQLIKREVALQ